VIRGPFEKYPGRFKTQLSSSFGKEIQKKFEYRSHGAEIHLTELQIVCSELYKTGKSENELEVHFNNEGDIEGIVESYIERSIESLKIDQREPAVCLVARMITPSIKRKIISRNELLNLVANEEGISSTLLSKTMYNLEQGTKLVRRVPSYRDYYYEIGFNEIADELLFGWIQKKFQKRTKKKKLVETKRGFWIASYLIVLNLLLIFALIKIWHKKIPSEADEERAYSPEILYLLIVVLTGALGNSIHSAWKFINDVSNRRIFQI
jgi:hypothetical protein